MAVFLDVNSFLNDGLVCIKKQVILKCIFVTSVEFFYIFCNYFITKFLEAIFFDKISTNIYFLKKIVRFYK